jgi:glycosyltransferase involved in cell wall biosynthesis
MTADTVGGVWTYAMELARGLAAHDAEVVLATMGARATLEQREEARACRNLELLDSEYKLEWMQDPWDDVDRAGDWLLALEHTYAPDVVHLNGYAHAALPWKAPVVVVAHSCVRSWYTAVRATSPDHVPSEWTEYTRRVTAGLLAATFIVAPTQAMLGAIELHYGPLAATCVIPNGRRVRTVSATKERLILSAGRAWDEAKNVAALGRVAPQLSWPVAIAGDCTSPDGATIELTAVQRLGRLGTREMAQWMSRSTIYALPARYEPFGLSAVEAALSGCALVLGDIPSLREVWGDAAVFVPPHDDRAIVRHINQLIADDERRYTLAWQAHRRAMELTPERMAAAYDDVYRRVAGRHESQREVTCAS